MPGDPFKTVVSGESLEDFPTAAMHNATIDVIKAHQRNRNAQKKNPLDIARPEGLKYVRNTSGATVNRFGVMTIDSVIFDNVVNLQEFQNNAAFNGISPDSSKPSGKFCVTAEPIADQKVGLAWVFGVCPVQINFTNADDLFADVKNGDSTQLQSDGFKGGAFVLWKQAGTGKQWAIVRLSNVTKVPGIAKITSNTSYAGKYNGTLDIVPTTDDGTGDLTLPDGMTTGASCLIINTEEDSALGTASATHRLKVNSTVVGHYAGMSLETPPRPVLVIRGGFGRKDSPTVLNDNTGGGVNALNDKWNREDDGTPVDEWRLTRVFWDTANNILYGYLRKYSYDARGVHYATSAETRYTIDSATDCDAV